MRLIDADALRKDIVELPNCSNGFSDTYDKAMILSVIDEQPTVDAVPVIRCKDCKHYTALGKNGLWGRCSLHASRVETARTCQSVDYCSWAERREE